MSELSSHLSVLVGVLVLLVCVGADNELWFRDMDLRKVSAEHDKRL